MFISKIRVYKTMKYLAQCTNLHGITVNYMTENDNTTIVCSEPGYDISSKQFQTTI